MIVDTLNNMNFYEKLLPQLIEVAGFIRDHNEGATLDRSMYSIVDDEVFALIQEYDTKDKQAIRWETHRKYVDVQFILKGEEAIGYAPFESLSPLEDFSAEKDIGFYTGPKLYTNTILTEGMFAIFFPGEGHLPCCKIETSKKVKKIVFKIRSIT